MKTKKEIFEEAESYLNQQGYTFVEKDDTRPWGGFFVIDDAQAEKFSQALFSYTPESGKKISPKILLVAPNTQLSWQYHHRRAERWKLINGKAGIIRSLTNDEGPLQELQIDNIIELKQGERHRLVGRDQWGVVAEIWLHTDPHQPSDENDIVRLQDDYGRK